MGNILVGEDTLVAVSRVVVVPILTVDIRVGRVEFWPLKCKLV
jgi:hypothetical protein